MNLLHETPPWVLIPLAIIHTAFLGYLIYVGVQLFRDSDSSKNKN